MNLWFGKLDNTKKEVKILLILCRVLSKKVLTKYIHMVLKHGLKLPLPVNSGKERPFRWQ